MKGYEWIGWLATVFLGFTMINSILGGGIIALRDIAILEQMKVTQNVHVGWFSIPVPGLSYYNGIQRLLMGDYSFFAGNAQILYFLYQTITIMIGFSIFVLIISIGVNAIRGR
jgi:hypothetical protein